MMHVKSEVPEKIDERINLIKKALESRCSTLHVKKEEQHILITGADERLSKKERSALEQLGIECSSFHAQIFKGSDEVPRLSSVELNRDLLN